MSMESLFERSASALKLDEVYGIRLTEFYRSHLHGKIEGISVNVRRLALERALFNPANLGDVIVLSHPYTYKRRGSMFESYIAFAVHEMQVKPYVTIRGKGIIEMLRRLETNMIFYRDFADRVGRLLAMVDGGQLDSIVHADENAVIHDICREKPELLGEEGLWRYDETREKLGAWLAEYAKDESFQENIRKSEEQNVRDLNKALEEFLKALKPLEGLTQSPLFDEGSAPPEALQTILALDLPPYLPGLESFKRVPK